MALGRPSEYSPEILTKTKEYIDSCEDKTETIVAGETDKYTKYSVRVTVNLPTIEGLARYLKLHKDTIYTWRKEKRDFSDLIDELLAKQAEQLINKGLNGDYNPTIAKVLLTKHGYTDRQEVVQSTTIKDERIPDEHLTDADRNYLADLELRIRRQKSAE